MAKNNTNDQDNDAEYDSSYDESKYLKLKYDDLKKEFIKKVEDQQTYNRNFQRETKLLIIDMIRILRHKEKKDKSAIIEQIKNDFLPLQVYQKSALRNMVVEEFDPMSPLKKKQKIVVGADGSQVLEEGSDDDMGEDDDIHTKREKAKDALLTKQVKKGSAQIPRVKPSLVNTQELEGDEEEEEEEFDEEEEGEDVTGSVFQLQETNNIVIEDEDHINEIIGLIKENKAIVVIVNQHLQVIGIQAGKKLTE